MTDENDDGQFSENILNHRACLALHGELVLDNSYGTATVADALCQLLKSPHEISREVRSLLVTAFERGKNGYRPENDKDEHIVRFIIEDLGPNSAVNGMAQTRFNYLEAAEEYHNLINTGMRKSEARMKAGLHRKLDQDSMRKKAEKFFDTFKSALGDPHHEIHNKIHEYGMFMAPDGQHDEDYYYAFRSEFVWDSARKEAGIAKALNPGAEG